MQIPAHAEVEGNVGMESHQHIIVPSGTPVAYKVLELEVNTTNGSIVPKIARGCQGGFVSKPVEPDAPIDDANGNYPGSQCIALWTGWDIHVIKILWLR